MSANDDLPQNICPLCSVQIKSSYSFILKCRESDRKLRLSLSNATVRCDDDVVDADDEFIDNEISDSECIAGEDSGPSDELGNDFKRETTSPNVENGAQDELKLKALKLEQSARAEFICQICNKSFSKSKSLARHKSIHAKHKANETIFQCTVCGSYAFCFGSMHKWNTMLWLPFYSTEKQMKHINHFKIHMRSHRSFNDSENNSSNPMPSESKPKYLCSTCGRACTSQSNLAVHTRRHTGTMTNFCKICGKGYPRSTDLTIHMRCAGVFAYSMGGRKRIKINRSSKCTLFSFQKTHRWKTIFMSI